MSIFIQHQRKEKTQKIRMVQFESIFSHNYEDSLFNLEYLKRIVVIFC